ncbi:hypothetical protein ABLE91_05570 [Aquabacter sp. CN5-332]|uniref:hypothetical protein n=1 Tax=Aquabacter sp. CN5-332 TaxID=3156608 RepID=UPI0032B4593A
MGDQFDTWRAMLMRKTVTISDSEAASGYYRLRRGDIWAPVAIWQEPDGSVFAMLGTDYVDVGEVWPAAAKNAVTYEAYQAAADGQGWPDDAPALPEPTAPEAGAENPRAVMGNNATTGDPAEDLRLELAGEQELAKRFLAQPITTQEDADKVAVWAKRVSDLRARGDNAHKTEKTPHLEAGRQVDERFRWRDDADALVKKLKAHLTPWLQKKDAEEKERARLAAEEARRRQEEADLLAAQAPDDPAIAEAQARAAEAAREAQPQRGGAGRTGAKVSLRTVPDVQISDPLALAAFYAGMKPINPDLAEVLLKLARRNIGAGVTPPGVTVGTKQIAA